MLTAASIGCGVDVVLRILQSQPDVNKTDNVGRTALHMACKAGRLSIVQVLMQIEDIDPNQRTCGGDTPLMFSVLSCQKELVCYCLEN